MISCRFFKEARACSDSSWLVVAGPGWTWVGVQTLEEWWDPLDQVQERCLENPLAVGHRVKHEYEL